MISLSSIVAASAIILGQAQVNSAMPEALRKQIQDRLIGVTVFDADYDNQKITGTECWRWGGNTSALIIEGRFVVWSKCDRTAESSAATAAGSRRGGFFRFDPSRHSRIGRGWHGLSAGRRCRLRSDFDRVDFRVFDLLREAVFARVAEIKLFFQISDSQSFVLGFSFQGSPAVDAVYD